MTKKIIAERKLRDAVALRRIGIFLALCMCFIIHFTYSATMNPSDELIQAGYQKAVATVLKLDGPIPDLPKEQWNYDYQYYYICEFEDENKNIRQGELCLYSPGRKDFKYKLKETITIYYPKNFQDGDSIKVAPKAPSVTEMSLEEAFPLLLIWGTLIYLVISYIYKRILYERTYGMF